MTAPRGAIVAGVAGWPVGHSLSPTLHNAWIAAAGLDGVYSRFLIAPNEAAKALRGIGRYGVAGLNITLPHKQAALMAADDASRQASLMGAANVLAYGEDGSVFADNTDGAGFLYGLDQAGAGPSGPVLVLGAGGAARAVIFALVDAGWTDLRLVNRTRDKAEMLADAMRQRGAQAQAMDWAQRSEAVDGAALVVNATSLGLEGREPLDLSLDAAAAGAVVYDLVYTPLETPLLAAARKRGLTTIDGLHMLIGQARPSFETFFGQTPPDDVDARALLETRLQAAP